MRPLEDGLEGMIESGKMPEDHSPAGAYLLANPAAKDEVASMMDLSRQIRENFRLSAEERDSLEVAPGFYARVLAQIEAQAAPPSIWNFFLEPFGRRLVYASLALALLLAAANVFDATPVIDVEIAATQAAPSTSSPATLSPATSSPVLRGTVLASDSDSIPVVESTSQDEDRGAALMQLTTYEQ